MHISFFHKSLKKNKKNNNDKHIVIIFQTNKTVLFHGFIPFFVFQRLFFQPVTSPKVTTHLEAFAEGHAVGFHGPAEDAALGATVLENWKRPWALTFTVLVF